MDGSLLIVHLAGISGRAKWTTNACNSEGQSRISEDTQPMP
jgi:hypothetical protein